MTIDIKENAQILGKAVKNCNSPDAMIVTLIPFLLAARLESPDLLSWKHGTEVTYLVQNHATTHHSSDSTATNMNYHLNTMFTCQKLNASLFCHFHDVWVNSSPRDDNQQKQRKDVLEDLWTRKNLLQDVIEIAYEENGAGVVWIPAEVDPIGRGMMSTLARLLVAGVDLSSRQSGHFESPSNVTFGICRTKYLVSQPSSPVRKKSPIMNLFLIPRSENSLASPLRIEQMVEDSECANSGNWYSFWAARALWKLDPKDMKVTLNSAENTMLMKHNNFTSFSRIKTTIENHKDNTKYTIDESISLTLQNISTAGCPHCKDDDSNSHEDDSSEEKNVFVA